MTGNIIGIVIAAGIATALIVRIITGWKNTHIEWKPLPGMAGVFYFGDIAPEALCRALVAAVDELAVRNSSILPEQKNGCSRWPSCSGTFH
jgi:hypothetical protein